MKKSAMMRQKKLKRRNRKPKIQNRLKKQKSKIRRMNLPVTIIIKITKKMTLRSHLFYVSS
ncbi:hypothetical protein [Salinicoccus sp. Marseille-QA3877]